MVDLKDGTIYMKEQIEQNENKGSAFKDCLLAADKDGLLIELHKLIGNHKGKYVAEVIYTCCKMGLIGKKPPFNIIKAEFGEIGKKQGFDSYYKNPLSFDSVEVDTIKKHLNEFK